MAKLRVALVSPEREVWTGEADMVLARTLEGEIGILPGHSPVLGVLVDGSVVKISPADQSEPILAMVGSGFLSVADDEVSVLAEQAELGGEIDVDAAREALRQASELESEDEAKTAERHARARLQAAGRED